MSYCLKICRCNENGDRTDEVVELPKGHSIFGPNVKLFGGESRAQLSVTINYHDVFRQLPAFGARLGNDKGIKVIDGYPLEQAIHTVANAINNIHTEFPDCVYEPTEDYWKATPANARKALEDFMEICHMCVRSFPMDWNKYSDGDEIGDFLGFYVKVEY